MYTVRCKLLLNIDDVVEYYKNKVLDRNCNIYKQKYNTYEGEMYDKKV